MCPVPCLIVEAVRIKEVRGMRVNVKLPMGLGQMIRLDQGMHMGIIMGLAGSNLLILAKLRGRELDRLFRDGWKVVLVIIHLM